MHPGAILSIISLGMHDHLIKNSFTVGSGILKLNRACLVLFVLHYKKESRVIVTIELFKEPA